MEVSAALVKLRNICSRQEKCPSDVVSLMKRWDVPPEHHTPVIEQLKAEKYIDEQRYASAFVRDKLKFDHWGLIKIRFMLTQKGISKDVTERVLGEVDIEEYRMLIEKELKKKHRSVTGTPYEVWSKLARYGSSRGYEMEHMQGFLEKLSGSD